MLELSLNSTTTINVACVVGGIVFARVRALVAKPPFWKRPPIWVFKEQKNTVDNIFCGHKICSL